MTSNVPSSKILVAVPESKGSKKYKTYLGLVDSGSSGSLVNEKLVEIANFSMQLQKKPIKWDTATGTFQTDGIVSIENYLTSVYQEEAYHLLLPYGSETIKR
jgi:hypothetical protein